MNLASAYTYYKNTNQINEELAKYRAITKADLQNAAKKYFTKENRVVWTFMFGSPKMMERPGCSSGSGIAASSMAICLSLTMVEY